MVMGERAHLHGLNLVGLRRHGFSNAVIQQIQSVFKAIFHDTSNVPISERIQAQRALTSTDNEALKDFFAFIDNDNRRNFCMPKSSS
jgi:UDP-N-acetylglucosamine acyltransferase